MIINFLIGITIFIGIGLIFQSIYKIGMKFKEYDELCKALYENAEIELKKVIEVKKKNYDEQRNDILINLALRNGKKISKKSS